MQGRPHPRVRVGLDLGVHMLGDSVGHRVGDPGHLVLTQLSNGSLVVRQAARPLTVEEVELTVHERRHAEGRVGDRDLPIPVEIGLPWLVVVGVPLKHQLDLRLARDAHHRARADLRFEVAADRRITERLNHVTRDHQRVVLADRREDR